MKKIVVIVGVVVAVFAMAFVGFRMYTKSFSPEGLAQYDKDGISIKVKYGRPFKKGRQIFGGLVPYGQAWRTGANEPTVFTTNTDLKIGNNELKAGSYSLFSIPNQESWQVIFNSTIPGWGVDMSGQAAREEATDALVIEVASINTKSMFEQFTIDFEQMHDEIDMVLMWDQTLVVVPIEAVK